jgi:hypothetical protein
MRRSLIIVSIALAGALGYFGRAYFEKPKVIEVPKERIITKTRYVDRETNKIIEVTTESTKFDTEAAVALSRPSKSKIFSIKYGADLDNLAIPVYGAEYQQVIFKSVVLGISGYSNGSAFVSVGLLF